MHRNKAGNITIVSGGPIKKLIAVVLLLDSGRIVGVLGVGYGSTQSTPNLVIRATGTVTVFGPCRLRNLLKLQIAAQQPFLNFFELGAQWSQLSRSVPTSLGRSPQSPGSHR